MKLVETSITLEELKQMSEKMFGQIVKAVVDVEMHSDQEELLLEQGSEQGHLWGINLHPFKDEKHWIEFDSMINVRPSFGNMTRSVDDIYIQKKIVHLISKKVVR